MFFSADDPSYTGPFEELVQGGAETGVRLGTHLLSQDLNDAAAPFMIFAHLPPNFVVPRHAHSTHRVEVLVRGMIHNGEKWLEPGDIMVSVPDEYYGPHLVGPDGCLTVEFFGHLSGYAPHTADGTPVPEAFNRSNTPAGLEAARAELGISAT